MNIASLCATIMNSQGGKGNGVPYKVEDFMPQPKKMARMRSEREGQRQTPEQQAMILSAVAAAYAGQI